MSQSGAALPFPLSATWGEGHDKLVKHILLAEFDLTTGSTLRHQYPSPVEGHEPDWFAEKMLPEGAHNREMDYTVFFLNPKSLTPDEIQDRVTAADCPPSSRADESTSTTVAPEDNASAPEGPPFLYCLNIVRTKHDSTARRGALVKALAICSSYHFLQVFRPSMELALDLYFKAGSPEDGLSILGRLYDSLNAVDLTHVPRPTCVERALMHRGVTSCCVNEPCPCYTPQGWVHSTHMVFEGHKLPVGLPLAPSSDEVGERCVAQLARTFREDTMRIYNAVLTGKRVLFVGYNHAASDVCKFVVAAACLVSPPLIGTIRRTCPYTSLSDLSFLDVPSYIAGVTNPMFESHEEWWDLLCVLDLPQGKGKCYGPGEKADEDKPSLMVDRRPGSEEEGAWAEMDDAFMVKVLSGVEARLGEDWVRAMFHQYTQTLVDYALDGSGQSGGLRVREDIRKAVKANEGRLKALKKVPEWVNVHANPWRTVPNLPVKGEILRSHLRLLELQAQITEPEVERIFSDLSKSLQSEVAVQAFLACLPESRHGLAPIASALLHHAQHVRFYACLLLQRLQSFESTRPAVTGLNGFLLMAYERVTEEMMATS